MTFFVSEAFKRGFLRRSDRRHVAGEVSGPVFVFSPDPSVFTRLQKKELRLFEADQVGKQEGNLSLVDFFFFSIDAMTSFSNKKERFSLVCVSMCGTSCVFPLMRNRPSEQ